MRIHAFNTARLGVKRRYVEAKGRTRLERLTSSLLDPEFTEIPVFVWVIEHPEGLIVIDVGETARVNEPDYFPLVQRPYWRSQYRFDVSPNDEIGAQMRAVGLSPSDVRWVVLTHAHFDHTDALYHFPGAQVVISQREHDDVLRYRSAHFAFPSKWPDNLRMQPVRYVPEAVGPFPTSFPLTAAGDVRIVPTPGHTMGHQSVLLDEDAHVMFFGGDASFDQESLLGGIIDAPTFNAQQLDQTRRRILAYARQTALVYLATHDANTALRLAERAPLTVAAETMLAAR